MNIAEKSCCSGCGSCTNICPKKCIGFKHTAASELVPDVDNSLCVDCGLCIKVCPHVEAAALKMPNACYAAYRKDDHKRVDSASGGIAAVLYENFHSTYGNKAVSYGVAWDPETERVTYKRALNAEAAEAFKGSKYVQPDIDDLHKRIKADLLNDMHVFVVGLPCHIAGLRNYLNIMRTNTEKLFCIDLLCHGASSHALFTEEVQQIKKKKGLTRIENVTFRSNRKNRNYHMVLEGNNVKGKYVIYDREAGEDPYFRSFLDGISLIEACYHCKFACAERVGDLTIGDYIGIGKQKASTEYVGETFNTSMVLTNTEKGAELLEQIMEEITVFKRPYAEAVQGGASLQGPFPKHPTREGFIETYEKDGLIKTMWRVRRKEMTRSFIKQSIKRLLIKAGVDIEHLKKVLGRGT